LIDNMNR